MSACTPDRLAVEQLKDSYLATECCTGFFACPGGEGNRIVGMATCRVCAVHILLRRALLRIWASTRPRTSTHGTASGKPVTGPLPKHYLTQAKPWG